MSNFIIYLGIAYMDVETFDQEKFLKLKELSSAITNHPQYVNSLKRLNHINLTI